MNQGELLDELLESLHAESKEPVIFDGASTDRERSAAKKKQAAALRKAEKRNAEIDSLFCK